MDEFSTYYALFNLRPEASHQDLKAAYKRLVKQWHPDRFASDPVNLKIAEEKIKTINVAYAALKAYHEGAHFSHSTSHSTSYTTSVKTRRTSPQDYFNDAKRLAKLGQYREAAEELSHAVKLEPKYAAAYHLRGILFTVLGFERRGGSDLRKAALLGVIDLDYDGEVIDLVQSCDDFKYFRHLLKKEGKADQPTDTRKYQHSEPFNPYSSKAHHQKTPISRSTQVGNDKVKDIRQERQRQKHIKQEKLKQEYLQREQDKQSRKTPKQSESATEEAIKNKPNSQQSQDIPVSEPVEEVSSVSQPKIPEILVKIEAEAEFNRQLEEISAMTMNASRKTIATGYTNGCIDLWNYKNKRNFHTLKGHEGAVTQVAFSADSQILFSGGSDGTMRLWNLSDGSFIRSFLAHQGRVTAFDLCHLRKIAITAGDDGVVRVWDLRENKLLREIFHHESPIPSLALNATGEIVACGVEDGSMRFCHTLRGGIVKWFTAHTKSVQALTFSQYGQTLASGSSQGEVELWQFPSGNRRQTCQSAPSGITALTFCQQGRLLCGADNQGRLMVWDVASGALLDTVSAHSSGQVNMITVADDGLLSAGADGSLRQWRLQIP